MARGEVTGRKLRVSTDLIERRKGPPDPADDEPTQFDEPNARVVKALPPIRGPPSGNAPVPLFAMSIPQFCTSHNISEGFFYKLKKQGLSPREMKIGTRTLITLEAAASWRAEREAASTERPEKASAKREQAD
jgi:hypothetical protein